MFRKILLKATTEYLIGKQTFNSKKTIIEK